MKNVRNFSTSNTNSVLQTLSLEEKERLAREQERQQNLNKQTVLQPEKHQVKTPTQPSISKPEPKNLTDTLINSNIANLSFGPVHPPATPNYNVTHSYNANSSFSTGIMFPPFQQHSAIMPTTAAFQTTPSGGQVNTFPSSGMDWGMTQLAYPSFNQAAFGNTNIPTLQPPRQWQNTSSLDTLLPSSNNVPKLTMNQMTNQRTATIPKATGSFTPQISAVPKPMPPQSSNSSACADLSDLLG